MNKPKLINNNEIPVEETPLTKEEKEYYRKIHDDLENYRLLRYGRDIFIKLQERKTENNLYIKHSGSRFIIKRNGGDNMPKENSQTVTVGKTTFTFIDNSEVPRIHTKTAFDWKSLCDAIPEGKSTILKTNISTAKSGISALGEKYQRYTVKSRTVNKEKRVYLSHLTQKEYEDSLKE